MQLLQQGINDLGDEPKPVEINPYRDSFVYPNQGDEPPWFHLAASSNHRQSADSICATATFSSSNSPGIQCMFEAPFP